MHKRRDIAWLVALAVGLMLIPVANASALSKAEKKQNAAIKTNKKAIAKVAANVVKVTKATAANTTAISAVNTKTDGVDTRLKLIEAGVPTIVQGLTDLKDASLQLKDGLTQLKDATTAGLTGLKTLVTSTEYGFGQVLVAQPTVAAEQGSFIVTPDIPDTVQQAQSQQQFVAQHAGNLVVAYGVRSAESDGTGASNPAALCKITVTNAGGTTQTTAPNADIGGLPFQPVDTRSALTSTDPLNAGFPFGLKTNGADADVTTNYVSTVAVAIGETYTVGLSCVDTSPSTTDPTA